MKVTYTKLKREDAWGLRVSEGTVQEGDAVTVTKRDGSTEQAVVGQLVWEGDDRDGNYVYLYTKGGHGSGGKDRPSAPREARHATPTTPPPRFVQRQAGEETDDDIPF